MKAFITSWQQQKHNQKTSLSQCNQIMSARVCIMRKRTHSINVCVCELVFELLHAIDTFTKRKFVNKQRHKACKQDINQTLLDLDSLGFESFRFGILNCPSLLWSKSFLILDKLPPKIQDLGYVSNQMTIKMLVMSDTFLCLDLKFYNWDKTKFHDTVQISIYSLLHQKFGKM